MLAPSLGFDAECRLPDCPTPAELLALMRSPDVEERDEALTSLSEMVGIAFGEDGAAIGEEVRSNGGPAILTWLLADPDPYIQQLTLSVLGNLCSDSVDPNSGLTKQTLLGCGGGRAILACVMTDDPAVLVFAVGALQNCCYDRGWAELVVAHAVHRRLEALLQSEDAMVVRYAAGTLKNITHALAEEGPDLSAELSADALAAVRERGVVKRREEFARERATHRIGAAASRIPAALRERRHLAGEERRRRAEQLAANRAGGSRASSRPASASSGSSRSSRSSYFSAKSSMTASSSSTAARR